MGVGTKTGAELREKTLIQGCGGSTREFGGELITHTEHAGAGLFYQLADHRVAEEPHLGPLHPLGQILLLLHLEASLDEHLLELLIRVVDDELFKSVVLEGLKAINIQYSQNIVASMCFNLQVESVTTLRIEIKRDYRYFYCRSQTSNIK